MRYIYSLMFITSLAVNAYLYMQIETLSGTLEQRPSPTSPLLSSIDLRLTPLTGAEDIQKLGTFLSEGDYVASTSLLVKHESLQSPHFGDLKEQVLYFAAETIASHAFSDAARLLIALLEEYPDDIDVLAQQVSLHEAQGHFVDAITLAYDLQYRTFESSAKDTLLGRARALARRAITATSAHKNWVRTASLCELALSLDQRFDFAQLHLARAHFEQGHLVTANSHISPLINTSQWQEEARILAQAIAVARVADTAIPLIAKRDQFMVRTRLSDVAEVTLLIDTGASICTLSQEIFLLIEPQVKATYIRDIRLNTAGGPVTASLYSFSSLSVADYRVTEIEVAVNPHSADAFDGLLGMNFLSLFEFTIHQKDQYLTLKKKSSTAG